MRRMISSKAQKYIKDLATNHPDPSAEWSGSGTTVTGTNDGTNWTSLTIDEDTYSIPQGGGEGFKTYGLTIEELNTKYGKGADMQRYSLNEIVAAGLPILGTKIANQSPYTSQLITVDKGDANEIILKDLFGVVRYEDGQYVVHVCRTNTSGTNAANEFYAYRIGDNDWIIKGARWANERNLAGEKHYVYPLVDLTDMNTFFNELKGTGNLYYYDTTQETYIFVEWVDTYDPDKTYYLFDGSSYTEQSITPEAYFNFIVDYSGGTLYIKVGDDYVEVVEYDAEQTYYERGEITEPGAKAEMFASTAGSDVGVSSDSAKNLVHTEKVFIQLDNPVMNVRYDNQVKAPTVEGNYVLGASVNNSGNPTFAWNTQPTLATVATTGDYDDLTNKPTIPDAVSGTNDGTNWTNLTIGNDTYAIPQGGGSSYTFTNGLTESNGTVTFDYNRMFGTVASNSRHKIGANYYGITISDQNNNTAYIIKEDSDSAGVFKHGLTIRPYDNDGGVYMSIVNSSAPVAQTIDPEIRLILHRPSYSTSIKRYIGSSDDVIDTIYVNEITDGTNTVSVSDLAALIAYAKAQGWIQ